MLRHAPPTPGVHLVLGDAGRIPLPDASVDGVLCLDALHHFRDLARTLHEARRVLKPGRRIVVEELDATRLWVRMLGRLEGLFGEPGTLWTPAELQHLLSEAGLPPRMVASRGAVLLAVAERPS